MRSILRLFSQVGNQQVRSNPDGSLSAPIPLGATVSAQAFVGRTAVVMDGAVIGPRDRIESGEIVTPEGRVYRFGGAFPVRSLTS